MGKWLQNGKPRGKIPCQTKREHALRLKDLLQEELSRKLGVLIGIYTPPTIFNGRSS